MEPSRPTRARSSSPGRGRRPPAPARRRSNSDERSTMDRVLGDKRAIVVLLGPALLIYTVVMLVPVFWSIGYTFLHGNAITGFKFVGSTTSRSSSPIRTSATLSGSPSGTRSS